MTALYRLVYTSRNFLTGPEGERAAAVAKILATSQANNSRVGVTGALLFNGGSFAQVLEGPRPAIESTFERIQRDPRHSDVSLLQFDPVAERGFPNWSMAFIGRSPRGRALWRELASSTGFSLARIEGEQLFSTLHAIVLAEEGLTDEPPVMQPETEPSSELPDRRASGEVLDVERLREELADCMPEARPTGTDSPPSVGPGAALQAIEGGTTEAGTASEAEIAILREALAEERGRTTELRRDLDEARIELARANNRFKALRQQHEIWAGRVTALAAAMRRELDGRKAPEHDGVKGAA